MVRLLPSSPTHTIPGQKLTPIFLSCPSDVPFVSKAYLFKKMSLKMEIFFESPQVLLSAHTMKSPVLPVLKVELAGFWEALSLNNMR